MSAKSQNSPRPWVDPDDAPELTDDFFEQGESKIGERPVSAQEGAAALRKASEMTKKRVVSILLGIVLALVAIFGAVVAIASFAISKRYAIPGEGVYNLQPMEALYAVIAIGLASIAFMAGYYALEKFKIGFTSSGNLLAIDAEDALKPSVKQAFGDELSAFTLVGKTSALRAKILN